MPNRDTDAAWRYHDATKHTYMSVRTNAHYLDWRTQPLPFKIFPDLPPIPLVRDTVSTGVPALEAIAGISAPGTGEIIPDISGLGSLLFLSAGITRRKRYSSGEIFFRAASCTGALYEIEIYLACQDLPGLAAGLYHFGPADFALRELRRGDYREVLATATGREPSVVHAPVTIVCAATYWRNAWKYQARTYRHFGWDNGTILANLLAAAAAFGLPARIVCGFVDRKVNELLSLDTDREVAFSMVSVGRVSAEPPAAGRLESLTLATVPLSPSEVDYPVMRQIHTASSLATPDEVAAWRNAPVAGIDSTPAQSERPPGGRLYPLGDATERVPPPGDSATERVPPPDDSPMESAPPWEPAAAAPLEEVIVRRGSTRQFKRGAAWSFAELSNALYAATQRIPADFLDDGSAASANDERPARLLNQLYLIVHAVEGLPPGAYVLHRHPWTLELLKGGDFRNEAGYLGLEQDLPADASAVVFFLADLAAILERFGNRGYRAAQLEAGILGGRLYLAAYAQRLGASGLTFYDDDVVKFFSPHAKGTSSIFCMTLGKSVKLARS